MQGLQGGFQDSKFTGKITERVPLKITVGITGWITERVPLKIAVGIPLVNFQMRISTVILNGTLL